MNLAQLQKAFLSTLLNGGEPASADARGMRVYQGNHRGQMLGSLRETYERVAHWVGDEAFECLALTYIGKHPSSSWDLNAYGATFHAHVADAMPLTDPAAELAWIDHALRAAFYARDVVPAQLGGFAVADWEQAVFTFVPSLRFNALRTNAPALWSALSAGHETPAPRLLPVPVAVRAWRNDLTPRFTSMPPGEAACLDLAMAGGTFGELCTLLAAHHPDEDTATVAGQMLREWFEDGLVAGVA